MTVGERACGACVLYVPSPPVFLCLISVLQLVVVGYSDVAD